MKGSIKHGNNIHHEHSNGIGKKMNNGISGNGIRGDMN
jgi:hypothetical protein